jgi:hypothetical protein
LIRVRRKALAKGRFLKFGISRPSELAWQERDVQVDDDEADILNIAARAMVGK